MSSNSADIIDIMTKIKSITPNKPTVLQEEVKIIIPDSIRKVIKNGIPIENDNWIMCICDERHIHKYYKLHFVKNKIKGCITCNSGSSFMKLTRQIVEKCLDTPFMLDENSKYRQYWSPIYKVKLLYPHVKTINDANLDGEYINITLVHKSIPNALRVICAGLRNITTLSETQHAKLDELNKYLVKPNLNVTESLYNILGGNYKIVDDELLCIENCKKSF